MGRLEMENLKRRINVGLITLLVSFMAASLAVGQSPSLKLKDLFPSNRVLDIKVTVAEEDWEKIRKQRRTFSTALAASRQYEPVKSPYSYVLATVTIDGIVFPNVGIRKKGFIGSQSTSRPSLKIKLNSIDENASIGGLTHLTLNNNKQDTSLVSQFLGYRLFHAVGLPASRCALAKVTVNGKSLGVYSHVESVKRPMIRHAVGNDGGTLYEGTAVDFFDDWGMSFERKFGPDDKGRSGIEKLIDACGDGDITEILGVNAQGKAHVPKNGKADRAWMKRSFDDSKWRDGTGGAGYDDEGQYKRYIGDTFDFGQEMKGMRSSLYLRIPFQVDSLQGLRAAHDLILRVQYDDGFIAYLNGVRVASANAPAKAAWDSVATGAHDDRAAVRPASFSIAAHKKLFRRGENVLSLHALNVERSSSDLLISASLWSSKHDYAKAISELVDLDSFYDFWALESLLGFWDGYAGNSNNFFIYLNPETDRFQFLPWGADALFEKYSRLEYDPAAPISVKTKGIIAYRLYQTKSGRARYARSMRKILKKHWNEKSLLKETDRLEAMLRPHRVGAQFGMSGSLNKVRTFIRNRRSEVMDEMAGGMPIWNSPPSPPFVMPGGVAKRGDGKEADSLWDAARLGDLSAIRRHLAAGVDVNAREPTGGTPPLSMAALGGQPQAVLLLLQEGAKVNASNFDGDTALHGAAFLGRLGVVRVLLGNKADVRLKNKKGDMALNSASVPWSEPLSDIIEFIANLIQVDVDLKKVKANRLVISRLLKESLPQ